MLVSVLSEGRVSSCADKESFAREVHFFFFFFDKGKEVQIALKAGHHRPASETPFKWRLAGGPMMTNIECWLGSFVILQGIRTSIAKKPYIL